MHGGESEINELLAEMTLEEKIGQLNLEPNGSDLDPNDIKSGRIGNVICSVTAFAGNDRQERVRAARMNELQRSAMDSRMKIPLLVGRDVIHGHLTVAPIPLGQAASWSPEDVKECGKAASREARADGINWIYAPMVDISRDPRWGRVAESYGEDPYLCSLLAKASVEGLQNEVDGRPTVAACVKHFVGYGSVEGGRDYNSGEISTFTLRNVYLPSFKAAVDAGVLSLMTCFNDLGGVPVTANSHLIREILKQEWGFSGFTVSDWNAVMELLEHRVAASGREAGALAFTAGVDMDMSSHIFVNELGNLLNQGCVSREQIDDSVRRVLRVKCQIGLFEDPYTDESAAAKEHLSDLNKVATLELARKTPVLLENRGSFLPFGSKFSKIGLFGPLAEEQAPLLGTWCVDGASSDVISFRAAMESEFGNRLYCVATLSDQCISEARDCDIAVVALGESTYRSGEANSVTSIELPPGQIEMLEGIRRTGVPIVAVVFAGRPIALTRVAELADAVLFAWHPGTLGSIAIAEILSGKTNPSGRLPMTFPRSTGQIPLYYNHRSTGRPLDPWAAGLSRYVDERDCPLYPFGYGLHYSAVTYEDIRVSKNINGFSISCKVTNIADTACDEVAQLYLRDQVASAARPVRELRGFERLSLKARQAVTVNFELTETHLGFYGPDERWRLEKGIFDVFVGADSRAALHTSFEL